MLQEDHALPHEPRQSGSFKALQDYVESDGEQPLFITAQLIFRRVQCWIHKTEITASSTDEEVKVILNLTSISLSNSANDISQSLLIF